MESTNVALPRMLRRHNQNLIQDCEQLESSLLATTIPLLLEPYRQKVVYFCNTLKVSAGTNIARLNQGIPDILEEIISDTEQGISLFRVLDEILVTPIVRFREEDVLCLKILAWMHNAHHQTQSIPVAFAHGQVSMRPMMGIAPIYHFPHREQQRLLHQALHFHEFGHGLYVLHKPEMDQLVKELQEEVARVLAPLSGRNDPYAGKLIEKQQSVVSRWYSWAQELFCDAVGLTIGGPAYLYAFSNYIKGLSQSDFYQTSDDLGQSSHPVNWLRVQFLVRRAKEMGLAEAATVVSGEWAMLAAVMQITQDYHGYYDPSMEEHIYRIISDMLIEASPRSFRTEEIVAGGELAVTDSPVRILNRAWQTYREEPERFVIWEKQFAMKYSSEISDS